MAGSQPPLTLIVAATTKNGIGKNGSLPWPSLKKEMAYFARVTKRLPKTDTNSASTTNAQNVVIMGRKTWDSIPSKFRPLKDRTNIVISSRGREAVGSHADVVVARSIEAGIAELRERASQGTARTPGRVFVIGGSRVYAAALEAAGARHVLLTRIENEYECDTMFPVDLEGEEEKGRGWKRQGLERLREFVGEEVEDGDVEEVVDGTAVRYRFMLYERSSTD